MSRINDLNSMATTEHELWLDEMPKKRVKNKDEQPQVDAVVYHMIQQMDLVLWIHLTLVHRTLILKLI